MRYITRPLTPEARARLKGVRPERSRFDSTWTSTLELLDRELWHLGVRNEFILKIDCTEADLRLDGELRANARPASSAVAVAIDTRKHGSMLFVCGKFHHWQHNVRAIALGLEALRKVERYGIVQSDEQYRGWQALPPGTPMPSAKMTVEDAARLLCDATMGTIGESWEDIVRTRVGVNDLYREAVKLHHPDRGGDAAMFARLTEARELLLDRSTL